jgi:threonine/homoserine/homoserine lactone efflux protein
VAPPNPAAFDRLGKDRAARYSGNVLSDALTFLGIVLVLTVTPGPDMALMLRHVLAHGRRSVVPTVAGIVSGLGVHATLCIAGLSVVLRESDVAFAAVKLVGGAWLAWMGISAILGVIRAARSKTDEAALEDAAVANAGDAFSARRLYLRALLTNILNVKIALLYIALLPQFAPSGDRFVPVALLLAVTQIGIGVMWQLGYGFLIARTRDKLTSSPRVQRWVEGSTGAALIGFGVRLASAAR